MAHENSTFTNGSQRTHRIIACSIGCIAVFVATAIIGKLFYSTTITTALASNWAPDTGTQWRVLSYIISFFAVAFAVVLATGIIAIVQAVTRALQARHDTPQQRIADLTSGNYANSLSADITARVTTLFTSAGALCFVVVAHTLL